MCDCTYIGIKIDKECNECKQKRFDYAGNCMICSKRHTLSHNELWVYYNNEMYCREHDGVMEWYNGALKIVEQKLARLSEKADADC